MLGRIRRQWPIMVVIALVAVRAHAFIPDDEGHLGITQEALGDIAVDVDGRTHQFTPSAIAEIRRANRFVDWSYRYLIASYHFDSDSLVTSSERIVRARQDVQTALVRSGREAREVLGRALHTLQDFYAHSNWQNLDPSLWGAYCQSETFNRCLGRTNDLRGTYGVIRDPRPCACGSAALDLGADGARFLTTGYFLQPIGCGQPLQCGEISQLSLILGECEYPLAPLTCTPDAPPYRCSHGATLLTSPGFECGGINKDSKKAGPAFVKARELAVEATKDFVQEQVIGDILRDPSRSSAQKSAALNRLMGVPGSALAVTIDATSSMTAEIAEVKRKVHELVDLIPAAQRPERFVLVAFRDPERGALVTENVDEFLAAVDSLRAAGGGTDCPEPSYAAIQETMRLAEVGDFPLYLFTDADPKDTALREDIVRVAKGRQIRIHPYLSLKTDSYCRVAPDRQRYFALANETGGSLLVLGSNEVGAAFRELARTQLRNDSVVLALASGAVGGTSRDVPVTVDSTVASVVFSVTTAPGGTVSLIRPSGAAVQPGDQGVVSTDLSLARLVSVTDPEVGVWRARVSGTPTFALSAYGISTLRVDRVELVAEGGRSGHEAMVPIEGEPPVGRPAIGEATVFGAFGTAGFALVAADGQPLGQVGSALARTALGPGEPARSTFPVPSQPFRIVVTGSDDRGHPYERVFPTVFRPQPLVVRYDADASATRLLAGETTVVRFIVTNLGAAGSFRTTVSDTAGAALGTSSVLSLAAGESAPVDVALAIPSSMPDQSSVDVTLAVGRVDDPSITNAATAALGVQRCGPLTTTRLTLAKIAPPAGDDTLSVAGTLAYPPAIIGAFDPLLDGIDIELRDVTGSVLAAAVPSGPYDKATKTGWKVDRRRTKWTFVAPPKSRADGLTRITIGFKNKRTPGVLAFSIQGKAGSYAATPPLAVRLASLPDREQCHQDVLSTEVCVTKPNGKSVRCKRRA